MIIANVHLRSSNRCTSTQIICVVWNYYSYGALLPVVLFRSLPVFFLSSAYDPRAPLLLLVSDPWSHSTGSL